MSKQNQAILAALNALAARLDGLESRAQRLPTTAALKLDGAVVENIVAEAKHTPPVAPPSKRPTRSIARVVSANADNLIANLPPARQAQIVATGAGYGIVVGPSMTVDEYRQACVASKAALKAVGKGWTPPYALYAWRDSHPGEVGFGFSATPEQNAAEYARWKSEHRPSKTPSKAKSSVHSTDTVLSEMQVAQLAVLLKRQGIIISKA